MSRLERLLRAAAAACLATAVAVAVHVAGGGPMPAAPGILVPLALAFAVSVQLAGAVLSRWRLAVAVTVSQALFHATFSLGSGPHLEATGGAHAAHDASQLALHAVGSPMAHSHLTPMMLAAHASGALATYAVLRRADVLVALVRRAATALVARLAPTTHARPRLAAARPTPVGRGRIPVPAKIVTLPRVVRGPPPRLA